MSRIWTPKEAYLYAYEMGLKFPKEAKITEHFYWNEAFANEPVNNVPSVLIFYNLKKIFNEAEYMREHAFAGRIVKVSRAYSSIPHNKKVSKAKLSCHTWGGAIDFNVVGMNSETARKRMILEKKPIRIEEGTPHCHIDSGNPYIPNGFVWGLFKP